jgi:hypothetical protein
MKRSGSRRPSPALVIACLALFVALGGTVLAATKIDGRTIEVKSLPGNRLQVGSLPANRLKGTIPGNRIAPSSIKGDRIDVGTLGQVPSAAHADSADTARHAQTATAADHAADATTINGRSVGCVGGKREFAGACWDLRPNAQMVTIFEASAACGAEGGELPSTISLIAFGHEPGTQESIEGEWTRDISLENPGVYNPVIVSEPGFVSSSSLANPHHYRCVTPLLG